MQYTATGVNGITCYYRREWYQPCPAVVWRWLEPPYIPDPRLRRFPFVLGLRNVSAVQGPSENASRTDDIFARNAQQSGKMRV